MSTADRLRAAGLVLLATLSFSALDVLAKYLTASYSLPFIVWVRYTVHCVLMILMVAPSQGFTLVRSARPAMQMARGVCLLLTTALGVTAISRLPLAETLAIAFLAPLIVVLLSRPLLGERPSRLAVAATLVGFVGVLLIVRPDGAMFDPWVAFALGTAVVYALYQLLTRKISGTETPVALLFYTALTGTVLASCVVPFYWPAHAISAGDALLLGLLGVLGGGGHFLLIRALIRLPASVVSPLLYIQLIWQTIGGVLVFHHVPAPSAVVGGLVIVAAGLMVLWSQRAAHRFERPRDES